MPPPIRNLYTRRGFLRRAASAAAVGHAATRFARPAVAQTGTNVETETPVAGVSVLSGVGCNVVLLDGGSGYVMIDSGSVQSADALAAAVATVTAGAPVEALFNTHWHADQTGGNDIWGANGTPIIAHENTRLWMSTEYYVDWQDHTYRPRSAAALPTRTFYSHEPQPLLLELRDEPLEYGHLREAHTDGDLYVFLRDRNVLVAGGAVASGEYPVLDYATGGWIGGLMRANERILAMTDDDTVIVPARGPLRRRGDVEAQHNMLGVVRERIENLMRDGFSAAEMVASGVTDEFDAVWGDNRERFVANVYGGLWWQGRLQNSL